MKSIMVFKETVTYCRTSTKGVNGCHAVVKCDCTELFVQMRIIITLFEAIFSKSIDRIEIHLGIIE